jgi:hypothetical protein
MTNAPVKPVEEFEGTRYLTIIVRLLLDAVGNPVRGELANVDGSTLVRFVGRDGLFRAMDDYLNSATGTEGEDESWC